MTCWRRLRLWQEAGVWERLHGLLLAELHAAGELDWLRAICDPARSRRKGGNKIGPSPVDRGRPGSKHHLLTDGGGLPLAWALTGSNRHDVTQLLPLVDQVPSVRGRVGRPHRWPDRLLADRGYDSKRHRQQLWQRGIKPEIAHRKTEHGSGLGRDRWVVERTFAWLHQKIRPTTAATRATRPPAGGSAPKESGRRSDATARRRCRDPYRDRRSEGA